MSGRGRRLILAGAFLIALSASTFTTHAALTVIPQTSIGRFIGSVVVNDFRPQECAGLTLINLVTGSGDLTGTNQNDLILGGAFAQTVSGKKGDDCILAGGGGDLVKAGGGADVVVGGSGADDLRGEGGNDTIYGRGGNDAIDGGKGNDSLFGDAGDDALDGGKNTDACTGGAGTDTFQKCETETQ